MANKLARICICICLLVVLLPLAIACIVMSQKDTDCDNVDSMGLDTRDYLLGLGITGIIDSVVLSITFFFLEVDGAVICGFFIFAMLYFFNIAWFIIGAIILFNSNIECIQEDSTVVVFALAMWCITAVSHLTAGGAKSDN